MRYFVLFLFISNLSYSQPDFTLDQIKSYPFPNELTGSSETSRIAWAFDEEGKRNVYVAEGPSFIAKRLTSYMEDTGQELSSVSISSDGKWIVYIRGGDYEDIFYTIMATNWAMGVAVLIFIGYFLNNVFKQNKTLFTY